MSADEQLSLPAQIRAALDEVLDPCSIGRGVPAGLRDMGMVVRLDVVQLPHGRHRVELVLRMTSPGCTFQLYFDQQVRARLALIAGVDDVDLEWSELFDWDDDAMSDDLKRRLRHKRSAVLASTITQRSPA